MATAVKLATAFVEIVGRDGQLKQDLAETRSAVAGWLGGMQGLVASVLAGVGGALSISALQQMIDEGAEAAASLTRLEAVIKATGGAAGFTAEELDRFSGELQNATTFDDDGIKDAMSKLLTFRSVAGDVFKRATEAALDLSATGFGDATGTAVQLGKALEDPTKGLTALTRVGVSFSKQQQERIKSLQSEGNLLEAQKLILAGVEAQVKGVAREMGKTPEGRLKRATNLIGDQREEIGKLLIPLAAWATEMKLRLLEALHAVVAGVLQFNDATGGLVPMIAAATAGVVGLVKAFQLLKAVPPLIRAVNVAMKANPAVLIAVAVGTLIALLVKLGQKIAAMPQVQKAWNEAVLQFRVAWERIRAAFAPLVDVLRRTFGRLVEWIGGGFARMLGAAADFVAGAISWIAEFVNDAIEWFAVLWSNGGKVWDLIGSSAVLALAVMWNEVSSFAGNTLRAFGEMAKGIFNIFARLPEHIRAAWNGSSSQSLWDSVVDDIDEAFQAAMGEFKTEDTPFIAKQREYVAALKKTLRDQKDALERARRDRIDELRRAEEEAGAKAEEEGKAKVEVEFDKLPTGMFGFEELSKKMQEALLKEAGDDKLDEANGFLGDIALNSKKQAELLKEIADKEPAAVADE